MINHAYSVLYGRSTSASSGVTSGLTSQHAPEVVVNSLTHLRGNTADTADAFAIQAVKILDGSTFRAVLWGHDTRMTLEPHELPSDLINSRETVDRILGSSGVLLQYATQTSSDIQNGYLKSPSSLERAAAILAGLVEQLTLVSA